jgi:hypothetical protein
MYVLLAEQAEGVIILYNLWRVEDISYIPFSDLHFQIQQYRVRMVEAGAGPRLFSVPLDPVYDSRTRACACAIWMAVGETPEGKDPRWWGGLLRPGEVT